MITLEPSFLLKKQATAAYISKILICHCLIFTIDIIFYSFGGFDNSLQTYDGLIYCVDG